MEKIKKEELPGFILTSEGIPCFFKEKEYSVFDFNAVYQNYFPRCTFTAAERAGGLYYLAGEDQEGTVHVFSSLMGSVWEERNLISLRPMGESVRPEAPVIRILYDQEDNQTFLVCRNGQIVTLPDCPRCVKIQNAFSGTVEDAVLKNREICMTDPAGNVHCFPVRRALQYRVSETFACEQQAAGAILVDVRSRMEYERNHLDNAVCVPNEELGQWLEQIPREQMLIFICHTGYISDDAARYARSLGYTKSFSLGGMLDISRIR